MKVASLIPFKQRPFPVANVGDELTGTTAGPLDYDNFGGYTLQATELGTLADHKLARESTRKQKNDELAVATYNLENLSPKAPQAKFDRLAGALVHNLAAPDIVALEEVQDDDGATDDGVVDAGQTLKKLTDAIAAAERSGLPVAADQPRQRPGRRPAGRQHPHGLPLQPRPRLFHGHARR
ncbi:hypothetical protein GCM10020000_62180 [Streptomyces olivoverticillatus]